MGPGPSGHTQGSVSARFLLVLRFENCWFRDLDQKLTTKYPLV